MLYEMTELLAPHCDVYVYFNNAFENKLIRQIAEMCVVRNVISRSLEGVGNQMYDDEIELLIDMSGHGLRNNDIALSWLDGRLHLEGLLAKYPMMLRTTRYFADVRSRANRGGRDIFIPGDVRCMSDPELQGLKALVDGGASRLAFVGHVFEDPMFPEAFKTRLLDLGFKEGDFVLRPCLLPFALYMDYLVGCLGAVIPEALGLLAKLRAADDRVVAEHEPLVLDEAGDRNQLHVGDEVTLLLVGRHEGTRPGGGILHEWARVADAGLLRVAEGVRHARVRHAAHAVGLHRIAPRESAAAAVARHLHVAALVGRGRIAVVHPQERTDCCILAGRR